MDELKTIVGQIEKLTEDFTASQAEAKKSAERAVEEVKSNREVTEETKKAVIAANEKMSGIETRLHELEQKAEEGIGKAMLKMHGDAISKALDCDSFKAYVKDKQGRVTLEIEDIWKHKAVTTDAASVGGAINPMILPGVYGEPDFPLTIRALLAPGSTTSNMIKYVKEGVFTDLTATVKEAAQKPKGDLTLTTAESPVRKIAHLLDVSMEALDDIAFLESYIRSKMMRGLKLAEEKQLLFGDGVDPNILGIMPQATAFDETLLTKMGITTPTLLDRLFASIIQINLAQYGATGFVLNPIDYGAAIMVKTTDGAYLMVNPAANNNPRIWGLPVVQSMNMEQGTFLTGAFRDGAQIFDRTNAFMTMSQENNDNFEKNMFTLRIEERLALALYAPKAFVTGTTAPAP